MIIVMINDDVNDYFDDNLVDNNDDDVGGNDMLFDICML